MTITGIILSIILLMVLYVYLYNYFTVDYCPKKRYSYKDNFDKYCKWPKFNRYKILKPRLFARRLERIRSKYESLRLYEEALRNNKCPLCNDTLELHFLYDPTKASSANNVSVSVCHTCRKRTNTALWP